MPGTRRWGAIAGGQAAVGHDDAGEAVGVLGRHPEPHQAAPVLADEGDVVQVELVEEGRAHPLDVAGVGVVGPLGRLVGAAEAHQVGRDAPQPGVDEHGDHVAVQEAPGRLPVHEQHHLAVGWPHVEVVDAEPAAGAVVHLHVVGGEVEVGQVDEAVVGGAEGLHGAPRVGGRSDHWWARSACSSASSSTVASPAVSSTTRSMSPVNRNGGRNAAGSTESAWA